MHKIIAGIFLLSSFPCGAQVAPVSQSTLRYHYGDNPAWAAPSVDDSKWTTSSSGVIPSPPEDSDGFLWVRVTFQVPLSANPTAPPLTLRMAGLTNQPGVAELFANGSPIGHWGAPPPHPQVWFTPPQSLFPLANATFASGSSVLIAARIWVAPQIRGANESLHLSVRLEPASTAILADGYLRQKTFLMELPSYAICFFVALLGLALAGISFVARRRVFVFSAMLLLSISGAQAFFTIAYSGVESLTGARYGAMYFILVLLASLCNVAFIWDSLALGCRPLKYLAFAGGFIDAAAVGIAWLAVIHPPVFAHFRVESWGDYLRNLLELGGALWGLAFRPGRRVLSAAIALAAGLPTLLFYFEIGTISIGSVTIPVLSISLLLIGCCVTGIMAVNAWSTWRNTTELQFQFSAARELQQQLVPLALPHLAGLRIEAAYLPAKEVGGDFYQIIPLPDNSVLIVIGDVSGKGLKAAMKGVLALGAMRALAAEGCAPAQLLSGLNREMLRNHDGGFITCLCLRLYPDGQAVLANAGHLNPYCNGVEVPVESGLPLGIAAGVEYPETALQFAPNDRLALLTDGVVEARNAVGELFGFDRTAAISTQSANEIAKAAELFGQEDDITVLTLTLAPTVVEEADHA